jgi:hypothetical protein
MFKPVSVTKHLGKCVLISIASEEMIPQTYHSAWNVDDHIHVLLPFQEHPSTVWKGSVVVVTGGQDLDVPDPLHGYVAWIRLSLSEDVSEPTACRKWIRVD